MRRRRKKNLMPFFVAVIFIALVLIVCVVANQIAKNTPSDVKADLYEYFGFEGDLDAKTTLSMKKSDEIAIVVDNERIETRGLYIEEKVYLPVDFVKDVLNSKFYWDEHENLLLYTTPTELITTTVGSTEYTVGKSRQTTDYTIVRSEGSDVFVAADYVQMYTKLFNGTRTESCENYCKMGRKENCRCKGNNTGPNR